MPEISLEDAKPKQDSLPEADEENSSVDKSEKSKKEPPPAGKKAKNRGLREPPPGLTHKQRQKFERRSRRRAELEKAGVHWVRRPTHHRKKKRPQEWFTEELKKQQEYMYELEQKHHMKPHVPQYKEETIKAERCYRAMIDALKQNLKVERGELEECLNFAETGVCKFGEQCSRLHPGEDPKTKIKEVPKPTVEIKVNCLQWQQRGRCAFGDKCFFVHEGPAAKEPASLKRSRDDVKRSWRTGDSDWDSDRGQRRRGTNHAFAACVRSGPSGRAGHQVSWQQFQRDWPGPRDPHQQFQDGVPSMHAHHPQRQIGALQQSPLQFHGNHYGAHGQVSQFQYGGSTF